MGEDDLVFGERVEEGGLTHRTFGLRGALRDLFVHMVGFCCAEGGEVRDGDEVVAVVFRRRGRLEGKEARALGRLVSERYGALSVTSNELPLPPEVVRWWQEELDSEGAPN